MMTYFYNKVNVKGQDLDHYPAKLLNHYTFLQNVFAFFILLSETIDFRFEGHAGGSHSFDMWD